MNQFEKSLRDFLNRRQLSPKVNIAAAKQADIILNYVLEENKC
ncbi:hypothetical protein JCM16358_02260 [Halanaerocella petrolearia]